MWPRHKRAHRQTRECGAHMATITKRDLEERICGGGPAGRRVEIKKVLQQFLDLIVDELGKGNRLEFRDFGVFEVKARAARTAQNPKTLQRVVVPAKRTVKFKAGREMRARLEGVSAAAAPEQPNGVLVETKTRRGAGAGV